MRLPGCWHFDKKTNERGGMTTIVHTSDTVINTVQMDRLLPDKVAGPTEPEASQLQGNVAILGAKRPTTKSKRRWIASLHGFQASRTITNTAMLSGVCNAPWRKLVVIQAEAASLYQAPQPAVEERPPSCGLPPFTGLGWLVLEALPHNMATT